MVSSNCVLSHRLTTWVSEVIYYCNYLEFGIICMFLTSFYAHFCVLCAQLVNPVRTPVAILGSLGVCIYVPASRHWLISYSPIHLT